MSRLLALDTNAYRALDDGNQVLAARLEAASSIGLPVIVMGEISHAIFYGSKSQQNSERLERFLISPRVEVLHITAETPRIFGEIATELRRAGKPIQQDDMWIAALCKQYGYTLATADVGFRHIVGLDVISF